MVALGFIVLPLCVIGLILQIAGKLAAALGYALCLDVLAAKCEFNELKSNIERLWTEK